FITITGSGFFPGTLVVKFNGVRDTTAAADGTGTSIQAHVAPGTPNGTAPVFVSVNGVQAPTNSGPYFTVIGPNDPFVDGFSPSTGDNPGTTQVTITGIHFTGITGVKFNGASASFSPVTVDNSFTATLPVSATTGPITVQ